MLGIYAKSLDVASYLIVRTSFEQLYLLFVVGEQIKEVLRCTQDH